jgi:uncharacterized protein (TIGR03083 family)
MSTTATLVDDIARIDRAEAVNVVDHEYMRMSDLLHSLAGDDWSRPTDCTAWDVRAMVLHLVAGVEATGSPRELVHQLVAGKRRFRKQGGHFWVDAMNDVQIEDRARVTNADAVARFDAAIPKAIRARRRLPGFVRAVKAVDLVPPYEGRQSIGWLMDVVYTRDVWMHRVDISRALGRDLVLTPDHDGRIVADVVAEWATLYDTPFDLELTGPAGGRYRTRADGEHVVVDAVEFVRIVSLRAPGRGVLANAMPL